MVSIRINNEQRTLVEIDESWISQQINRRRAAGQTVCVQVTVNSGNLNLTLSTPTCAAGGGGRAPNHDEQEVFDLWAKLGLNDARFTGGELVAFLKQLRRLI